MAGFKNTNAFPLNLTDYAYNAKDVMRFLAHESGVASLGDNLKVVSKGGLSVGVRAGYGWLSNGAELGVSFWTDTEEELAIRQGDPTYDRWDSVIVTWDTHNQTQRPKLIIREGVAGGSCPRLVNNVDVAEIKLADIQVRKNSSQIKTNDIFDRRHVIPNLSQIPKIQDAVEKVEKELGWVQSDIEPLERHVIEQNNPHKVTAEQLGLEKYLKFVELLGEPDNEFFSGLYWCGSIVLATNIGGNPADSCVIEVLADFVKGGDSILEALESGNAQRVGSFFNDAMGHLSPISPGFLWVLFNETLVTDRKVVFESSESDRYKPSKVEIPKHSLFMLDMRLPPYKNSVPVLHTANEHFPAGTDFNDIVGTDKITATRLVDLLSDTKTAVEMIKSSMEYMYIAFVQSMRFIRSLGANFSEKTETAINGNAEFEHSKNEPFRWLITEGENDDLRCEILIPLSDVHVGDNLNQLKADGVVVTTTIADEIAKKQDKLTFDTEPTSGSTNPVTSGGVWDAWNEVEEYIYRGSHNGKDFVFEFFKSGRLVYINCWNNSLSFEENEVSLMIPEGGIPRRFRPIAAAQIVPSGYLSSRTSFFVDRRGSLHVLNNGPSIDGTFNFSTTYISLE